MRPSSSLVLGLSLLGVVFVTLVAQAAVTGVPSKGQNTGSNHVLVTGQDAFTSRDPVKDQGVRVTLSAQGPRNVVWAPVGWPACTPNEVERVFAAPVTPPGP
ncbi:Elafin [Manis pentadactyla]|nr:Elafin [Manis pentadactyla]